MKITNELFETKISYEKVSEQGKNVKVTVPLCAVWELKALHYQITKK